MLGLIFNIWPESFNYYILLCVFIFGISVISYFDGLVPSHMDSWSHTRFILYIYISLVTKLRASALYRITFQVQNLMSVFLGHGRFKEAFCDVSDQICFYSLRLLTSRQTSKLEDHSWSTVHDSLFNISAANPPTRNPRGRSMPWGQKPTLVR